MVSGEGFEPSEHDQNLEDRNREEIRDPEDVVLVRTPKAKEAYHESEGKLLISPENLMPKNVSVVVGARTAEKGSIDWTDTAFAAEAGVDPNNTIRVQQGHTGNVIEVGASVVPAFNLIKDETGKVVEDKRLKTSDGEKVDSCWTKDENVTLMIGSADCAAITIAGKDKNGQEIIGIAHSGIAGTQKDIVGNLIREMIEKGDADPASFKVYVAPSICDKCFPILSEAATEEQIAKAQGGAKKEIEYDWEEGKSTMEVDLTSASASFEKFREQYGEKFKELYRRELHQNDFFYIAQNDKGQNELHYRVDNQILVSLMCNGVHLRDIGFSEVCTKNDGLPSARGTQETTGVYSTITIKDKASEHTTDPQSTSTDAPERRAIENLWAEPDRGALGGATSRGFDKYAEELSLTSHSGEGEIDSYGITREEFEQMLAGGKVLDVACGEGRFVKEGLEKGHDVYGVDLALDQNEIMDRVIQKHPELTGHIQAADATALPFEEKSFKTILNMFGAPSYLLDPGKAVQLLKDQLRVLEDSGRIIICPVHFVDNIPYPENWVALKSKGESRDDIRGKGKEVEKVFADELSRLEQSQKITIKKYIGADGGLQGGGGFIIIEKVKPEAPGPVASKSSLVSRLRKRFGRETKE